MSDGRCPSKAEGLSFSEIKAGEGGKFSAFYLGVKHTFVKLCEEYTVGQERRVVNAACIDTGDIHQGELVFFAGGTTVKPEK